MVKIHFSSYLRLLFLLHFSFCISQTNPDFFVAPNGVTCMCPNANFGDTGTLNINGETNTYTKRSRAQLDVLINANDTDPQIALTCTSTITDMSNLFKNKANFNQDISSWDVSNVTDMSEMFFNASSFNQALSAWDVSGVNNMLKTFAGAVSFNQPLASWDVSAVTNMFAMFANSDAFNQSINNWNISNVVNSGTPSSGINSMFSNTDSFNQPLNNWDVSNLTQLKSVFANAAVFNQSLNDWDVSNVINLDLLFNDAASFNQPLDTWDVSNVISMSGTFKSAFDFNQPLNDWDVSNTSFMGGMFNGAISFNQPLDNWDVSNVNNMGAMFWNATSFNKDISGWCAEQFETEPAFFSVNSPLQDSYKPDWGEKCQNLSVANSSTDLFIIYPNPINDQINFRWEQYLSGKSMSIEIFDINGKSLYRKVFEKSPDLMNVAFLNNGAYLLKVSFDGKQIVNKIIKTDQ